MLVQEEIKIVNVDVYVNPYTEPDEEEEKEKEKASNEKNAEDEENVSFGTPQHCNYYFVFL